MIKKNIPDDISILLNPTVPQQVNLLERFFESINHELEFAIKLTDHSDDLGDLEMKYHHQSMITDDIFHHLQNFVCETCQNILQHLT